MYCKIPVFGWDFFFSLSKSSGVKKRAIEICSFFFLSSIYISPLNTHLHTMENTNSSSTTKAPTLCTAGCGFYGSEAFNNMCSQCFKAQNKSDNTSAAPAIAIAATTADKIKALPQITKTKTSSPPKSTPSTPTFNDNASIPIAAGKSRKHLRSPSPSGPRMSSAPASSIASPVPSSTTSSSSTTDTTSAETNPSDKPVQLNKGRCFKCRSKVYMTTH